MMKEFNVTRTKVISEYATVYADTEDDALEEAQGLSDFDWEENPNDEFEDWDYEAEEV